MIQGIITGPISYKTDWHQSVNHMQNRRILIVMIDDVWVSILCERLLLHQRTNRGEIYFKGRDFFIRLYFAAPLCIAFDSLKLFVQSVEIFGETFI